MTDWAKLKVVDLKAELKRRDLPQHGLKAELVARLTAADEEAAAGEEAGEEAGAQGEEDTGAGDQAVGEEQPAAEEASASANQDEGKETEQPQAEALRVGETAVNGETTINTSDEAVDEASQVAQEPVQENSSAIEPTTTLPEAQEPPTAPAPAAEPEPVPGPQPTEEKPPSPQTQEITMEQTSGDSATDSQKRKRRSLSPPPDDKGISKRARVANESLPGDVAPAVRAADQEVADEVANKVDETAEPEKERTPARKDAEAPPKRDSPPREAPEPVDDEMDYERTVAPSVHPATSALYISNLMRPLRPIDIQTHLIELATPPRTPLSNDVLVQFHLDQIRTHAFVVFSTTSAASRVRTLLHDTVWPNESNRKALWVDFIPPQKVEDWIETESSGGGRSGTRWEVVYSDNSYGSVEARLESATGSLSRPGPPPFSAPTGPRLPADSSNNIPLGPRSSNPPPPPTGPRAKRTGPGPFPPGKRTRTNPVISYAPVSEDLARRRIDNMRSFYSDRRPRDLGREINRYSFENGDSFVDRGKEIFEGIRPPHRERGRGGGRGGGGRGGFGGRPPRRPRPRSDRYLPGGRDDRPPPPRYYDDRR